MVLDSDTTDGLSFVSIKPFIQVVGEPIISLAKGGTYNEQGVLASEVALGENDLEYIIVEGAVDVNTPGFYVVKYEAVNEYGWANSAYRAVLVSDGSPYGTDISGNYKYGFIQPDGNYKFETSISKYPNIQGYWLIDNVYQEGDIVFPVVFADMGNGTYNVVPAEHAEKGAYIGTAERVGANMVFKIWFVSKSGVVDDEPKEFTWQTKP